MSVIGELATEALPIFVEIAAKLANTAGRNAVPSRHVEGALARHHVAN